MTSVFRNRILYAITGLSCCVIACGGGYGSPAAASDAPALKIAASARLGNHLVDGNGRSLYYFGKDLPASGSTPAVSNCSGGCAAAWPIFHAGSAAVEGISASDVGEITRADGSRQTTFRGWPLYYFAGDANPGDVNGEGVDDVWFVLRDQAYSIALLSNAAGAPQLYLTDGDGRSLYYFSHDTQGTASIAPVSACTGACISTWLIYYSDKTVLPSFLSASDVAAFTRPDGKMQSAYKGHPLYFYVGDSVPGDTKGRGINGAWDTLDPRAL